VPEANAVDEVAAEWGQSRLYQCHAAAGRRSQCRSV